MLVDSTLKLMVGFALKSKKEEKTLHEFVSLMAQTTRHALTTSKL